MDVSRFLRHQYTPSDFARRAGVPRIGEIGLRDFSVWLVRSLRINWMYGPIRNRPLGTSAKLSMQIRRWLMIAVWFAAAAACVSGRAADFDFYGRSGDAIALDFSQLPGVGAGATFGSLDLVGFGGHTVLTSDTLGGGEFTNSGKLWVFPNPARDIAALGDINPDARGFQGTLSGSVLVDGESRSFSVQVQPGYTGSGATAVGQSLERLNRAANNPLYVAQQQQRLRYYGFVRQGGAAIGVTGNFDAATDQATRTFQAAFLGGVNTTQNNADGIIGPISAGWLNAGNAPTWEELIDPDPQVPGQFSVANMIGDFDILPARDPGTGVRSGLTPQTERFATSWTIDLIKTSTAGAKQATGRTQLINGMSYNDGYGSSCCHSSHRVGMDIDLHVDASTWNNGNGVVDDEEQKVITHALQFITAGTEGSVARILTSNDDILDGINTFRPGTAVYDSSDVHINHLHIDVAPPTQVAGMASLPGDFNFDNIVDAADYTVWRDGLGMTYTTADYMSWKTHFGAVAGSGSQGFSTSGVVAPEPPSLVLMVAIVIGGTLAARRRELSARSVVVP